VVLPGGTQGPGTPGGPREGLKADEPQGPGLKDPWASRTHGPQGRIGIPIGLAIKTNENIYKSRKNL